jgi:hypothetical protein
MPSEAQAMRIATSTGSSSTQAVWQSTSDYLANPTPGIRHARGETAREMPAARSARSA